MDKNILFIFHLDRKMRGGLTVVYSRHERLRKIEDYVYMLGCNLACGLITLL